MNQNGQSINLSLVAFFVFISFIFLIVFAFLIPFLLSLNNVFYQNVEPSINIARNAAIGVQDANVRTALLANAQNSKDAITTNSDVLSNLFQYSWAIFLIFLAIVFVIAARRSVEARTGGGVF